MLLKLTDIVVNYGRVRALFGISMEMGRGEIVCLVGPNGAGKSTTLKTISGLIKPVSGTTEFADTRIDRLRPDQILRMGIAHCPEGRRVFPDMTVLENLEMGAYNRRGRDRIATDLEVQFESFPILGERKQQLAGTLSGGEQQMLAVARALMSKPKLLLFDEPSLGLAPFLVQRVVDTIRNIRSQGITILLVEQNARMALEISDRAYVLETGNIALEGPAADLLRDEHVKAAYLGVTECTT